ncbi:MAG: hypothetical protein IIB08_04690 [Bacteroidetes bacterium]|nr:hypothetical protein [Bacteroidota bacterium]
MLWFSILLLIVFINLSPTAFNQPSKTITVGSKKFTENVLLGEIVTQLIRTQNVNAIHIRELGGTRILWSALLKGDVDVYPDYTGTIIEEILADENVTNDNLKDKLSQHGIGIVYPLGFNNTYAIGMKKEEAEKLGIEKISGLRKHPNLKFGFTNEFMDRKDGWRGLQRLYNLPQTNVNGLDHDLAYRGLASSSIDVIDLYSTDAEINYYNLKVLEDDLNYFTDYQAVLLYRKDLAKYYPQVVETLQKFKNIHDLFVNHRHYKCGIFFMTRRPQDLLPLAVESSEFIIIFALPNSDNIERKMKAIHKDIQEMRTNLTKDNHKFIVLKLGDPPVLMNAVVLDDKTK